MTRIPHHALFHPIVRVEIAYYAVTIVKHYTFPWVTDESYSVWHLEVTCRLADGQEVLYKTTCDLPLKDTLDLAYMLGTRDTLEKIEAGLLAMRA